jgi:hypothetical protein
VKLDEVADVLQSLRDQPRQEAIDRGWAVSELAVEGPSDPNL